MIEFQIHFKAFQFTSKVWLNIFQGLSIIHKVVERPYASQRFPR